jgi:hypothetical protein
MANSMSDLFYSQRQRRLARPPDPRVGCDFWIAFDTYLVRLSDSNYFCKEFPSGECAVGPSGWSSDSICGRLREEIGPADWPIPAETVPETGRILDLIEFFYRYAAKPIRSSYCDWCRSNHPEQFSIGQGRQKYFRDINAMLARFNHPYKLHRGSIVRTGSEVLDARIAALELRTDDPHLVRLLNSALENFLHRSGARKLEGLRSIVDAFERLKTLESADKKKSATGVIAHLSPHEDIRLQLDDDFQRMTEWGNKCTIRHHERDKVVLDDEALIDYLFYSYYNLVRLILEKYGLVVQP